MARQKHLQGNAQQLSLFDPAASVSPVLPPEKPLPEQPQEAQPAPLHLPYRGKKSLSLAEMVAIRTWLKDWGTAHSCPAFSLAY